MKEELTTLRSQLDVPETTSITVSTSPIWPKTLPLKVYLAMGLDMVVRSVFVDKINEWNKKEGDKHGTVTIVTEIDKADLILARYTVQEKVSSNTGTYVTPVMVYDPGTGGYKTTPVARSYSTSSVPAYSYMITPTPKGLEIIWRDIGPARVGESKYSGQIMRDHFFKFMKSRK